MNELTTTHVPLPFVTVLLVLNSILIVGFILNQNESSKDSVASQNSNSSNNPFEKLTWISFGFQLSLLLIKIKNDSF